MPIDGLVKGHDFSRAAFVCAILTHALMRRKYLHGSMTLTIMQSSEGSHLAGKPERCPQRCIRLAFGEIFH
jgi:hypothetical protein